MGIFRSHRQAASANNRVIGLFFLAMTVCALAFGAALAVHYVLGWF